MKTRKYTIPKNYTPNKHGFLRSQFEIRFMEYLTDAVNKGLIKYFKHEK